jgi:hypothetical protein
MFPVMLCVMLPTTPVPFKDRPGLDFATRQNQAVDALVQKAVARIARVENTIKNLEAQSDPAAANAAKLLRQALQIERDTLETLRSSKVTTVRPPWR